MKYMLILNSPHDGYTQYMNWPKEILQANFAFMEAFTKRLSDGGELVGAEGPRVAPAATCLASGSSGGGARAAISAESSISSAGWPEVWVVASNRPAERRQGLPTPRWVLYATPTRRAFRSAQVVRKGLEL